MTTRKPAQQTKAEQAATTRAALIGAATKLFAKRGYADVGTEEIVRAAKVTRGALYHHFADKKDLFRAVYESVEQDTVERVTLRVLERVADPNDPWAFAVEGAQAFLDLCLEPTVQRIAIVDALSVLGLHEWRAVADRYGGALVQASLAGLVAAGEIPEQPLAPLSRMLTGALTEGAIMIAEAEDKARARQEVGDALVRILEGLRA